MSDWVDAFSRIDSAIQRMEQNAIDALPLSDVLSDAIGMVRQLFAAYFAAHGKVLPVDQDILDLLKDFVKGDPSLNAVRDNVRELVYYQNCLAMGREDALPTSPARMAVHTARHIYLYLRSRLEQGR